MLFWEINESTVHSTWHNASVSPNISTHKHLRSSAFEITKDVMFEACSFEDGGSSESLIPAAGDQAVLSKENAWLLHICAWSEYYLCCFCFSVRFMLQKISGWMGEFLSFLGFCPLQTLLKSHLPSQRHFAGFFMKEQVCCQSELQICILCA